MIRAAVFDLDDTLISELDYMRSGYRHVAEQIAAWHGLDAVVICGELLRLAEESPRYVFNRWLDKAAIPYEDGDIAELVRIYREHQPDIAFFSDVMPLLSELQKRRLKTGIITDGYAAVQKRKLEAVEAEAFFDQIIITDELGREFWKPHPKAFELMQERLAIEFDEMMYVGDNPGKDFFIASIYPIRTVRILRENAVYRLAEYKEGIKESRRVDSLAELPPLLDLL